MCGLVLLLLGCVCAVMTQEPTQRQPVACHLPRPRELPSFSQRRCRANMQSWSYQRGRCVAFPYGGCEVPIFRSRRNKFMSQQACQQACVCTMPPAVGLCKTRMTRFYFNTRTRRCEEFQYTGCFGNGNNFVTEETCMQTCDAQRGDDNLAERVINEETQAFIYQ